MPTKLQNNQCYVIYGSNFKPVKIKGLENKNKLIKTYKKKGLKPKSIRINNEKYKKTCKKKPTKY